MKKIVLALLIAMLVAGGAFAVDFALSAGVGGLFTMDFGGGLTNKVVYDTTGTIFDFENTNKITYSYAGYGGYAFFDATYVEVDVGYIYGLGLLEINRTLESGNKNSASETWNYTRWIDYTIINFSLLGKYPIALNDDFTLFPLLGVDYRYVLAADTSYYWYNMVGAETIKTPENLSQLWFKGGLGLDWNLPVSDVPMYVRLEALFGVRLPTVQEEDDGSKINTYANTYYWDNSGVTSRYTVTTKDTTLGMGFTVKLAVGYKF